MLGFLLYTVMGLVVALAANWIRALFTKAGKIGESPAAGRIGILWLVTLILPYSWVEIQTKRAGSEFDPVIDRAYKLDQIAGTFVYAKVQHAWGSDAKIIVVSEEKEEWGGTYRGLYQLISKKDGGEWALEEVRPINTLRGDSAGFVFPPYW